MLELDKVHCCDALNGLKMLPDDSIDCVTTSPPYWALRDYKIEPLIWDGNMDCSHSFDYEYNSKLAHENRQNIDGGTLDAKTTQQFREGLHGFGNATASFCSKCGAWKGSLGLEPTFHLYIEHLLQIFDEVKRVLKKSGTCWVNLGDTYSSSGGAKSSCGNLGNREALLEKNGNRQQSQKMDKSLCQIPSRFAIGMSDHGWILRNEIIWYKRNCMPSSVKDRFTVDFEKVFFFVKNKKYFFETQYEPYSTGTILRTDQPNVFNQMGGKKQDELRGNPTSGNASRCNLMMQSVAKKRRGLIKGSVQLGTEQHHSGNIVYGKYQDITTETTNRQGMNKLRGNGIVEKRYHLLPQKEFVDKIRQNFKVDDLVEKTGLPRTLVEHWFRYDVCFAYPTREDWEKTGSDLFPELLDVCYESDAIEKNRMPTGRNKRCVWDITTNPFKEAHFAVFPETLIEPMIKAGCPVEGTVLDPFFGSGTTGVVSRKLLRHYIGFELNPSYVKIANKRLARIPARLDG